MWWTLLDDDGQPVVDVLVEVQLAVLDERQDGDRRERLGDRGGREACGRLGTGRMRSACRGDIVGSLTRSATGSSDGSSGASTASATHRRASCSGPAGA